MELPRITRTPFNQDKLSSRERLADASRFIANLTTNMPAKVEQGGLFKISLVPPRLAALREVQRYRMAELSVQAHRCLTEQIPIAGAVVVRAAMETAAVLFYVDNVVRKALKTNALAESGNTLLRLIVGSKIMLVRSEIEAETKPSVESVNVLTMIDHAGKMYPGFAESFAYLCEVAHPNQMGALVPYGEHAPGFDLLLSPRPIYAEQFAGPLSMALALFEWHYNSIADNFAAFVELCRRDAPRE